MLMEIQALVLRDLAALGFSCCCNLYWCASVVLMKSQYCTWMDMSSPVNIWSREALMFQSLLISLMDLTFMFHRHLSLFKMWRIMLVCMLFPNMAFCIYCIYYPAWDLVLHSFAFASDPKFPKIPKSLCKSGPMLNFITQQREGPKGSGLVT